MRRTKAMEMATIFAVWGIFTAMSVGRVLLDPDRAPELSETSHAEMIWRASFYLAWAVVTPGIFWLSEHLGAGGRWDRWRRTALHVLAALGVAILIDTYSDAIAHYYLQIGRQRVDTLSAALAGSMRDVMSFGFTFELIVYLAILGVGFARAYYRRLQQRQMQAAELRAQLTEARLHALRMQINPHFLFNTLNAVSGLVERDPRGVRTMVARLSALLRHTLAHDGKQEVTVAKEMDVLNDYLEIMHVRFEDRLRVERRIEPDVRQALVPDMILQPIVENAIKHGISPKEDGGTVVISAGRQDTYLRLRVQDDGDTASGDAVPDFSTGIGLQNVRERLQQLYGDDHRVSIRPAPDGGLVVELWLPYHTRPKPVNAVPDSSLTYA